VAVIAPNLPRSTSRGVERLLERLHQSWSALSDITDQLIATSQAARSPEDLPQTLKKTHDQYETLTRLLLTEPVEQFARLRPIRRSLEAMQECDREASPTAVRSRAPIDERFQSLLAHAALDLCEPWRIRRSGGTEKEWLVWEKRADKRNRSAQGLLGAYRKWAAKPQNKEGKSADSERPTRYELWWRRQTAVSTMHEMELAFRDLGLSWLNFAESLVASLRREREEILTLTEKMVRWIADGARAASKAPVESMLLATYDERLRGWSGLIQEEAAKQLPESAEVIANVRPARWRKVRPREAFLSAFTTFCQPGMTQSVREYWEDTARIAREASRSKEIIDYWRQAAESQGDQGQALFADARENAASVLAEQLRAPASDENLELGLVGAFRSWGQEGSTVLEAAQIGWVLRRAHREFKAQGMRLAEHRPRLEAA